MKNPRQTLRIAKDLDSAAALSQAIVECNACPRLRRHCVKTATDKRKAYALEEYWGRPVPGFGDARASLYILGLAPAAHGANRTGRVFTGDRSGDWLYRALHRAGYANQAQSTARTDGLKLKGAYVSCAVHCAPPDNKPTTTEIERCYPYLTREIALFKSARVYLALGGLALDSLWRALQLKEQGVRKLKFGHGAELVLPNGKLLLCSYHPSQQNTFTGRLTAPMFDSVFARARGFSNL